MGHGRVAVVNHICFASTNKLPLFKPSKTPVISSNGQMRKIRIAKLKLRNGELEDDIKKLKERKRKLEDEVAELAIENTK
ncbi:Inhibitory synaptic factor 1 [Bienertia sinuspersici]